MIGKKKFKILQLAPELRGKILSAALYIAPGRRMELSHHQHERESVCVSVVRVTKAGVTHQMGLCFRRIMLIALNVV